MEDTFFNLSSVPCMSNCTGNRSEHAIMVISSTTKELLYCAYSIIFVLGILGNLLVIFMFGYKKKFERTFDVYIVSLAFADLFASFFNPIVTIHDLITDLKEWKLLGTFGCKLFVSIDHLSMLVSAQTLIIISVERMR